MYLRNISLNLAVTDSTFQRHLFLSYSLGTNSSSKLNAKYHSDEKILDIFLIFLYYRNIIA